MRGREIDIVLNWWNGRRGKVRGKNSSDLTRKLHDGTFWRGIRA